MAATSRLHLHHAECLEPLLDTLAAVLGATTTDPFAPEMVVVPTVGMADATMAGLGKRLGICTNIEFVYPGRFLSRALGHTDRADTATDPWRLPQLGWAVLEALSADSSGVPGVTSNGVTWPLARHIADLFDRYATQRPQLIRDWAANIGKPNPVDTDGAGNVLDPDHRWQPTLWRSVRQLIGTPSGPELLPSLAERIAQGLVQPQLPARVFVFGVSSLQPTLLAVLEGLAPSHEVHVFLEYPSAVVWERPAGSSATPPSIEAVNHPLLTSWGRPALATHALLRSHPAFQQHELPSPTAAPNTLLGTFQQALRTDNPALADPAPNLADGTLQIHACHGVTRQLEVLRDALGHCFLADPTLQPHEVIVLCPDLEAFAPLIPAVFSRGSFPVPVHVGDRSLTSAEPAAQALSHAAQLVVGRASLSGVIDLLQLEPVRRRFGLDHADIENITEWCLELGTRWGLDTQHRTHAGLPTSIANGTWRATIDQLLAGVAMSAPSPRLVLGGARPYDDLSTDEHRVVGALAELLQILLRLRDLIDHPVSGFIERTVHEWCTDLHTVLDDLVSLPSDQGWRIGQVHQAISAIADSASLNGTPCEVPFTFPAMLSLLESSLIERAGRVSLRSGAVTVTSMVPQHGVPARVICILGLDDSVLRSSAFDGDDILGQHPCLGERHPRSEQRQVLLDAVLDATDRLIITCNGADLTTNAPVPLVVPIAELLDSLSALTGRHLRATGNPAQRGVPVVVHHKRHPFDESNFVAGALTASVAGPFAFDTSMLEAALARRTGVQNSLTTAVPPVLPTVGRSTVTLDDLVAAVATPAKVLLRDRLQVRLPERDDATLDDSLPLTVERLTEYDLGRELLDAAREGTTALPWPLQAALRPDLPPGELASAAISSANKVVGSILTKFAAVAGTAPSVGTPLPIDLVLQPGPGHHFPAGTVLFGTVAGVVQHPTDPARRAITSLRFTKLRPSMRLGLALQLAASTLTEPDTTWEATLVCRAESVDKKQRDKLEKYSKSAHLQLVGDSPELRAAAAHRLLAMAADLAHQAYNTVVPYLDRCSHAVGTGRSTSDVKSGFGSDTRYDLYAQQFWADTDPLDFQRITLDHATEVWGTYTACIEEVVS